MSNQNINISSQNISGKCDLKCAYNFKYQDSNSTATNNGVLINLSYDSRSSPPVMYNNEKYNVSNINIVSPSIHTFNNKSMPGEIIIYHAPVNGGNNMAVAIPFTSSNESSSAASMITQIIQTVSSNAPSENDSTNLNMNGFTLQTIVPRKPFFAYTDENASTDWIVYGENNAIPLSSNIITKLQQIIKPYNLATPGGNLFYNSKGPSSGLSIGDGIYISCQPTGSSEDEVPVTYEKTAFNADFSHIFQNPTFFIILLVFIGSILFIIIFYGINKFYTYISGDSPAFKAQQYMRKMADEYKF